MQTTRKLITMVALAGAAACSRDQATTDAQRNLDMANQGATVAPQLNDNAVNPGASGGKSAPKAAPGRNEAPMERAAPRASGTIAAGTGIELASNTKVCTNTNQVGDVFTADVSNTVSGERGARIPAGSKVSLQVLKLAHKAGMDDAVVMDIEAKSITIDGRKYALSGANVSPNVTKTRTDSKTDDVTRVGAGAAIGAAAGALLGKSAKGAIIGAAAGTAAGVGAAAALSKYEGCINQGAAIRLTLGGTLVLN
jgi:hypothetical protein